MQASLIIAWKLLWGYSLAIFLSQYNCTRSIYISHSMWFTNTEPCLGEPPFIITTLTMHIQSWVEGWISRMRFLRYSKSSWVVCSAPAPRDMSWRCKPRTRLPIRGCPHWPRVDQSASAWHIGGALFPFVSVSKELFTVLSKAYRRKRPFPLTVFNINYILTWY